MQPIRTYRYVAISAMLTIFFFGLVNYLSCTKDKCKDGGCLNAGVCNNGTCICPTGFTGVRCEHKAEPCAGVTCHNGGSCSNGVCDCPTGTTGPYCDTIYRDAYSNTYKGNGTDNIGGTYTNFRLKYSNTGTSLLAMKVYVQDSFGVNILGPFPVTLTNFTGPSTAYVLSPTVIGIHTYGGAGTITTTKATLNLTETGSSGTVIYTFANFMR